MIQGEGAMKNKRDLLARLALASGLSLLPAGPPPAAGATYPAETHAPGGGRGAPRWRRTTLPTRRYATWWGAWRGIRFIRCTMAIMRRPRPWRPPRRRGLPKA